MNYPRIVTNPLGILALAAVMVISFFTPWSESGSLAKLVVFPFLAGAICFAMFSCRVFLRVLLLLVVVLCTALYSDLHSNGFDWRMDDEWGLVYMGLALHAFFGLVGFSAAYFGLRACKGALGRSRPDKRLDSKG